jgi:hypothetical protein
MGIRVVFYFICRLSRWMVNDSFEEKLREVRTVRANRD